MEKFVLVIAAIVILIAAIVLGEPFQGVLPFAVLFGTACICKKLEEICKKLEKNKDKQSVKKKDKQSTKKRRKK